MRRVESSRGPEKAKERWFVSGRGGKDIGKPWVPPPAAAAVRFCKGRVERRRRRPARARTRGRGTKGAAAACGGGSCWVGGKAKPPCARGSKFGPSKKSGKARHCRTTGGGSSDEEHTHTHDRGTTPSTRTRMSDTPQKNETPQIAWRQVTCGERARRAGLVGRRARRRRPAPAHTPDRASRL